MVKLTRVYDALKKIQKDGQKEGSPVREFVDKIRDKNSGSQGQKFDGLIESFTPLLNQSGETNHTIDSKFIEGSLTGVAKGNRPKEGLIWLEWLKEFQTEDYFELLDRYGVEDPDDKIDYDAFICWSGDYGKAVAEAIKTFVERECQGLKVFLSSRSIKNGEAWRAVLDRSLSASAEGLLLVTQDFTDSEYGTYEYGVLKARTSLRSSKENRLSILLLDAPSCILPAPLMDRHVQTLDAENLRDWIHKMIGNAGFALPISLAELEDNIAEIREIHAQLYVTADEARWKEACCRPVGMSSQQSSVFDLEQILRVAQSRAILIAQNHWHMTDPILGHDTKYWSLIKGALSRSVDINLVAMHEDAKPPGDVSTPVGDPIDVWGLYMEKREQFRAQLREAWIKFELWNNEYFEALSNERSIGRLTFHGVYFAPVTMMIVDPEEPQGFASISPRPASRESGDRPQFIVRRKHEPTMFAYYWKTVKDSMANGGWHFQPLVES